MEVPCGGEHKDAKQSQQLKTAIAALGKQLFGSDEAALKARSDSTPWLIEEKARCYLLRGHVNGWYWTVDKQVVPATTVCTKPPEWNNGLDMGEAVFRITHATKEDDDRLEQVWQQHEPVNYLKQRLLDIESRPAGRWQRQILGKTSESAHGRAPQSVGPSNASETMPGPHPLVDFVNHTLQPRADIKMLANALSGLGEKLFGKMDSKEVLKDKAIIPTNGNCYFLLSDLGPQTRYSNWYMTSDHKIVPATVVAAEQPRWGEFLNLGQASSLVSAGTIDTERQILELVCQFQLQEDAEDRMVSGVYRSKTVTIDRDEPRKFQDIWAPFDGLTQRIEDARVVSDTVYLDHHPHEHSSMFDSRKLSQPTSSVEEVD